MASQLSFRVQSALISPDSIPRAKYCHLILCPFLQLFLTLPVAVWHYGRFEDRQQFPLAALISPVRVPYEKIAATKQRPV